MQKFLLQYKFYIKSIFVICNQNIFLLAFCHFKFYHIYMKKLTFVLPLLITGIIFISCVSNSAERESKKIASENSSEQTETIFPQEEKTDLAVYKIISKKEKKEYCSYELSYPVFSENPVLNKGIEDGFLFNFNNWLNSAKEEIELSKEMYDEHIPTFAYEGSPESIWNSSKFISIVFDEWSYLGGAHGYPCKVTVTYSKEKNKIVSIEEATGMSLEKISHLCYETILEKAEEGFFIDLNWIQTGTDPDEGNYQSFAITEDGKKLIVFFNPYQIAPYSEGIITIQLEL